ncbi:MAG: chemotaxis protein CheA [Deltaproteobacteria bacterium]|nr:chemotaxis protein CheA [Deltaproteobacteria bacterium]
MADEYNQFRDLFFEEAAEHIETMEGALLRLEGHADDPELLHRIFRGAHSIKGGSGMLGFGDLGRFTHLLESLLDRMRAGTVVVTPELIDLLLRATDALKALLAAAKADLPVSITTEQVLLELEQLRDAHAPGTGPRPRLASRTSSSVVRYQVRFLPGADLFRQGIDPLLLLRNLGALGEVVTVQADLSRLPALEQMDPERCYLTWTVQLRTEKTPDEINEVFAFVLDSSEVTITALDRVEVLEVEAPVADGVDRGPRLADPQVSPVSPSSAGVGLQSRAESQEISSLRVSTEKIDKLINLVGELVITQSKLTQSVRHISAETMEQLQATVAVLERHTRELQEHVLAVRMLPIGNMFSRFPRLVRDLSASLKKEVTLHLGGEETELDKGMLERLVDPLTHLIRNALDHGLETPDERRNAGKEEQGVIRVQAAHQGGKVIVEVSDDGRGLPTERIREKGIALGLIAATDALSTEQIHALIFQPGFSTTTTVTDVSGRGVGLDVVKRNVDAINGSVSVASLPGRGTRFLLKLPLTLAILDGLSLRVGEHTYLLPLINILESIQPRPEQVKTVLGQGEVLIVRGEVVPLLRLHRLFDIPTQTTDPSQGLAVIVEHDGRMVALLVDELLDQQQVVIKSLEANFRKIEGIAGATILGDGRVALILDVGGLVMLARGSESRLVA